MIGRLRAPSVAFSMFSASSFVSAALLFSVQPMVTKLLLPHLGGSSAVWNTAMVFFQVMLLLGYWFAHFAINRVRPRANRLLHVGLLVGAAVVLPISLPDGWSVPSSAAPAGWVLLVLLLMVGAPFLALSALSPALQRWLADSDHPRAGNPYFLYSASNAGSLLALLAYPVVVEPLLSVDRQARWWAAGYVLLVLLIVGTAALARPATTPARFDNPILGTPMVNSRTRRRERAFWSYAAFVPSALMLGVTRHISTDVASFPLLWIIPLTLYLLTFVIAFRREPVKEVALATRVLQFASIPAVLALGVGQALWMVFGLSIVVFFTAALLAHGRLMLTRPDPSRLTEFYLWISIGGATGGIMASLVAPALFDSVIEYPIGIVLALTLIPRRPAASSRFGRSLLIGAVLVAASAGYFRWSQEVQLAVVAGGLAALVAYGAFRESRSFTGVMAALVATSLVTGPGTLSTERTFFGVYRVFETPDGSHIFASGTTVHGLQREVGALGRPSPSSYYHAAGPIGQILTTLQARPALDVAIVGLGAGVLAAYARPTDRYHFIEIDPVVLDIALDPDMFTYLSTSAGELEYTIGDGRLILERLSEKSDLIVLDAFSSDAIPTHLLTTEAVLSYFNVLKDGGLIAFHISNRHLDLEPVLGRIAEDLALEAFTQQFAPTPESQSEGAAFSRWVIMSSTMDSLREFASDPRWARTRIGGSLWTDSFSGILEVIRWR